MNPRISAVIPIFNSEKTLAEVVGSVLSQTFSDFELILVDDGSTDSSLEIANRYARADGRVKIIRQNHIGIVTAVNRGCAAARAALIARVDADDRCDPRRFEFQSARMDRDHNLGLLGTAAWIVNDSGKKIVCLRYPETDAQLKRWIWKKNPFVHSSVCFRKKAWEELGGYRDYFLYAADYDLWTRMMERYAAANLREPLVFYRVHSGQVSFQNIRQQMISGLAVRQMGRMRLSTGIEPVRRERFANIDDLRAWGVGKGEIQKACWAGYATNFFRSLVFRLR